MFRNFKAGDLVQHYRYNEAIGIITHVHPGKMLSINWTSLPPDNYREFLIVTGRYWNGLFPSGVIKLISKIK